MQELSIYIDFVMVKQIRGPRHKAGFVMNSSRDTDLPGEGKNSLGPTVSRTVGLARQARQAAAVTEDPERRQKLQEEARVLNSLASQVAARRGIDPHVLEGAFSQIRNSQQDGLDAGKAETLKIAVVWGHMSMRK